MLVFLYINGLDLSYTQLELEDMIVAVADSHMSYEELVAWIYQHIKEANYR